MLDCGRAHLHILRITQRIEKGMERFSRHHLLAEIGEDGQKKIGRAKVLVVGAGGLGSPVLLYLAAAGVGCMGVMDDDLVSESNLQRQILYDTECIGKPKVMVAREKLQRLNPLCRIEPWQQRLHAGNAVEIIGQYDLVVDATDNLPSRYVLNDACVALGKPFVYGSICEFEGQVSVFNYRGGPTYRDLYEYHEGVPDFKQPLGVIGALPGVIGALQAAEAIKVILESPDVLSGRLLLVNLLKGSFQTIRFAPLD